MSNKSLGNKICRHCGGALIDKVEEVNCIMCGRPSTHICENCQYVDAGVQIDEKDKNPRAA